MTSDQRSSAAARQARHRAKKRAESVTQAVTSDVTSVTPNDPESVTRNVTNRNDVTHPRARREDITYNSVGNSYTQEPNGSFVDACEERPKRDSSPKRGSRLRDDWAPDDADVAFGRDHGLTDEEIGRGALEFRNYWTSLSGQRASKSNWSRVWQNRVIELADRKRRRSASMAARPAYSGGGGQGPTDFASIIAQRRGFGRDPDDVPGEPEALLGSFRVVGEGA